MADYFIIFEEDPKSGMLPVKGETKDAYFKTFVPDHPAFELTEFTLGDIENASTIGSATAGGGATKAKFNAFTITKQVDSASPAFFRNCVAGAHYKKVTLAVRKPGGDPKAAGKPYLQFRFGFVFTTKVGWAHGDPLPTESISFEYGALEVEYTPQKLDGTMGQGIPQGWNQCMNKAWTNTDPVVDDK
jgi:type VI protein secretion system component Hcp